MVRVRSWLVGLACVVMLAVFACSSPSAPGSAAPNAPAPPAAGGAVTPGADVTPLSLGMTVLARDERGAPRLMRAIVPRRAPAAVGLAAAAVARDHLAALAPLYLGGQRGADLTGGEVQ